MEDTVPSTPSMSDMLERLLSNPELLKNVGTLLKSSAQPVTASASASAESDTVDTEGAQTASAVPSMASDGLSRVLSDPDLLKKLPQMMETLRPMLQEAGVSVPASAVGHTHGHSPSRNCRDDLLLALKPFLSPHRAEAVDMIIRLSRLGNVLGALQ